MIRKISLDQFFQDLRLAPQLPFAWVLGAGAAVTSQVPTGRTLALRWMKELFEVQHPNASEGDYATWDAAGELGLAGLDPAEPAPFYGALYNLRFGHHPKLGQEFLRSQLLGRTPSYGYSALAQIQTESEHKYAVTTNFDHLLEEACAT